MPITKTCENCNKQYQISPSRASSRFCSRECFNAGKSIVRTCEGCGIQFKAQMWQVRLGQARFCSRECIPSKRLSKQCAKCGIEFTVWPSEASRRFCSKTCLLAARKDGTHTTRPNRSYTANCIVCAKEFNYYPSNRKNPKYCSHTCRKIDAANWKMIGNKNRANAGSKRGKGAVCRLARRRFGNVCAICGWNETDCDGHHIIPVRDGGKNILANVIVLCPNHHRMAEKDLITQEQLFNHWYQAYGHLGDSILDD